MPRTLQTKLYTLKIPSLFQGVKFYKIWPLISSLRQASQCPTGPTRSRCTALPVPRLPQILSFLSIFALFFLLLCPDLHLVGSCSLFRFQKKCHLLKMDFHQCHPLHPPAQFSWISSPLPCAWSSERLLFSEINLPLISVSLSSSQQERRSLVVCMPYPRA